MMKKAISLILVLMMLFTAIPFAAHAAEADAAATGDYTDPDNPYIATTYEGLMDVFNETRYYGGVSKVYIKLGADLSYKHYDIGTLVTSGADIELDLAGYTITYRDESNYSFRVIRGRDGAVTIKDSKRYDASKGQWVAGKIDYEYLYPYDERNTAVLSGNITIEGGTFINRTHSKASHSIYADYFYNTKSDYFSYEGGSFTLTDGVLEAETPILLGKSKNTVISGGELHVKKDVGIRMDFSNLSDFTTAAFPTITKCTMSNASGNEKVLAFALQYPTSYTGSHTKAQEIAAFGAILTDGHSAFVDTVRQPNLTENTTYVSGFLLGPAFQSSFVICPAQIINNLNVIISEPSAGAKMSYDAYVPTGARYAIKNYNVGEWHNGVLWEEEDGTNMTYGSSFELGKIYTVSIIVEPTDPYAYPFEFYGLLKGSVNGQEGLVSSSYVITYTFPAVDKIVISNVNLTMPVPQEGEQAEFSVTYPISRGYEVVANYSAANWQNGVHYQTVSGTEMAPGFTFVNGERYWASVILRVSNSSRYKFASTVTATVNGKEAIFYFSNGYYRVDVLFTVGDPTEIRTVAITMPEPKAGVAMPYTASAPDGEPYRVSDYTYEAAATKNGVTWQDADGINLDIGEKFAPKAKYTAVIMLEIADESYHFADDAKKITATVNGQTAKVQRNGNTYSVYWKITTPEITVTEINYLDLIIPAPVAGEAPSFLAGYASDMGYCVTDFSEGDWQNGVVWSDKNGELPTVFEYGETYKVIINVVPVDTNLYQFIGEDEMTADINGLAAEVVNFMDRTYGVCYSFTVGAAGGQLLGDVDGDGEVTILDATAIQRVLAELTVKAYIAAAADADEDGDVTIMDATAIQRHLAELPANVNIGKPLAK